MTHRLAPEGVVGDVASAFVLGGLAATLSTGAPQPPATARVSNYQTPIGAETLADLRAVAASYRRAYRSVPASQLYLAAHEHLSLTLALRPAYQPAAVQTELLITVGEMAALAGTLLTLDLGQVGDAGQYLELAHRAAREACAVELEAVVLGCRSFHAAYGLDDRRLGLDFAEVAVTIARDGAHPLTRGWVAAVASERHADVGDDHRTHRRLDAARHALSLDGGSTPWLGIGAFDHAKATAYEGGGLRRLGHHHQAVTVLSTALDQLHPTMYRHRTTALIDRAEAQLSAGDVDAACADAGAALELTSHTGHAGSTARLEALARATLTTRCAAARRLWQDLLAAKATTMGSR